jgi:hypothetical protein
MSEERGHWSDHMSVREGRDIARYHGRDEHGHPESFDTLGPRDPTEAEMHDYFRELKARRRRMLNPDALRLWLEADLSASGYTFEGTLATVKRGRLSAVERPRYNALALRVAQLRDRGARLEVIGQTIGKGARTVANLEARGRDLMKAQAESAERAEPTPCQSHEKFEADCPTCLRNAPERAVPYSGWVDPHGRPVGGFRRT